MMMLLRWSAACVSTKSLFSGVRLAHSASVKLLMCLHTTWMKRFCLVKYTKRTEARKRNILGSKIIHL